MAFPIVHRLVPPAPEPLPPDFARLTTPLSAGLPQTIELDREISLAVTLPNGLARSWLEADPSHVVSSSADELAPAPAGASADDDRIRSPLRLLVLVGGALVAAVPLAAGLRRTVPDDASGDALVELVVLGWDVRAGSLRGPGDAVSNLDLAWRRVIRGSDAFEPPRLHPAVAVRLARGDRLESEPVQELAGEATAHRKVQRL